MINVIKMQMQVLFKRKITCFMYFFMYILVFVNFFSNAIQYYGYDLYQMYSPLKLVFLGDFSSIGFYYMQYFPFVVIIPTAFLFFLDKNSGELIYIETRADKRMYYWGSMMATFITTFIIYTVPLIIEVVLNCITFPLAARGDLTNMGLFEDSYHIVIEHYMFSELWLWNPYIYTLLMIVLYGITSSLLACFTVALSMSDIFKYKILLFVPVYALLYIVSSFQNVFGLDYNTNYFFYLRMFCFADYNEIAYITFVVSIGIFSIYLTNRKIRKDELN